MKRRFEEFFFGPVDPRPLAIFRIVSGALMLASLLTHSVFVERDYGTTGMMADISGKYYEFFWFSILDLTREFVSVHVWWWVQLAAALAWTVGLFTRFCSVLLFLLSTAFLYRNLAASNAEQLVWRFMFFFSIFLPVGDAFSVDEKIRRGRQKPAPVCHNRWALVAFHIHLCLIYIISTPWKWFFDEAWRNGDAVYYVAISDVWSRGHFKELFLNEYVSKFFTWSSLLVEGTFGLLVWVPRLRKWLTLEIIGFQILVAILCANVTYFTLATAGALLVFFEWRDYLSFRQFFKLNFSLTQFWVHK